MRKYKFYIGFYGKKLKIVVEADSISKGKSIIKDKIIFHKIEPEPVQKHPFDIIFGDIFK
jgi:hypothetical protein